MHDAWRGLKTLAGLSTLKSDRSNMPSDKQKEFSDELKDFYYRFDTELVL